MFSRNLDCAVAPLVPAFEAAKKQTRDQTLRIYKESVTPAFAGETEREVVNGPLTPSCQRKLAGGFTFEVRRLKIGGISPRLRLGSSRRGIFAVCCCGVG